MQNILIVNVDCNSEYLQPFKRSSLYGVSPEIKEYIGKILHCRTVLLIHRDYKDQNDSF